MRLLIITQKVDKNDPVLGFFHRWIEEFAKHCESIVVICLGKGAHDLPENVKVFSLGKEEGESRIKYVYRFYKYIWQERRNYVKVFVHMNQEYVLLGGLWWRLTGKKVMLWRNHAKGSFLTRLAALMSDRVFCTSPASFTARFKKTEIMPVGIDTEYFKPDPSAERVPNSILFLGRIAPVKRVLEFVEWFNALDDKFTATVAGGALPQDKEYEDRVKALASPRIKFVGPVTQDEALRLYQTHETYVNKTPAGSFDKTIVEAAACGMKLMVENPAAQNLRVEEHGLQELVNRVLAPEKRKDKILFLINSLGIGGAEKMFSEQERLLRERGYNVRLKTVYGDFGFRYFFDAKGLLSLCKFVRGEKIDIIYSTLDEANVLARVAKVFCPRVRVVIREANDPRRKSWKFKLLDLVLNCLTYRIVAVSRGVARELREYQGIYKNKIVVVENGIEAPDFNYDEVFDSKSKNKVIFLNIGSLTKQKNQLELLRLFKDIQQTAQMPLELVIVGEGVERPNIEKFISENRLRDSVKLIGAVERFKVKEFYFNSHIYVSVSKWEGFPNTILEAGAYGLPVIALKTFGVEDLIEDGVSGFLINGDDIGKVSGVLKKLSEEPRARYDVGQILMNRVRNNYSMEGNISRLIALFA